MSLTRVLIAGIGNIFLGDDAFGVEVARRLAARGLPEGARVVDFGIRGLDLTYALLDGYEAVIFVDAHRRLEPPGTLSVLELAVSKTGETEEAPCIEGHNLDPSRVIALASSLGASLERLILVGCEPSPPGEGNDFGTEMSAAARAAVEEAVPLILSLVERLLRGDQTVIYVNASTSA